jgi:hypothetical protein
MKKTLLALAFSAAAAEAVHAQERGMLGQPEYGGTGCPQGSATAALSPNGQAIAVLFDRYAVEVGGPGGRPVGRASCNLAIPVEVPDGLSVAVFAVDLLGFNLLPEAVNSTVRVEYFFAGGQGEPRETVFAGPLQEDFWIRHPMAEEALVWSGCGEDVILRTNSSILLTAAGNEIGMTTIEAAVGYRLQWRTC